MKLLKHLEKQHATWFLLAASLVFFLLRLPSFFEPYWYGDEGIYEVIGFALRHGRSLYTSIWDNKPPLLYLTYSLFNGSQPLVRIASCFVGILAIIILYFLTKKLFIHTDKESKVSMWVTGLFVFLFGTPVLEGNIANAENFMLFPIFLAALLVVIFVEKEKDKPHKYARSLLIPGLLLGIAFLFKVVAVFDFAAFFVFLFIVKFKNLKEVKRQLKPLIYFTAGFFLPLFLTLLFFLTSGNLSVFIQSAFLSNVGYVGYGNKLIIPQGLLFIKLILLGGFICFVFIKRKNWDIAQIFIFLWLAFSIFNALFSQRPYVHYAQVLLGSTCLLVGLVVLEKKIRMQLAIVAAVVILFVVYTFSLFSALQKSTIGYYSNFSLFLLGKRSTNDYIGFFDKAAIRDYTLANFFSTIAPPYSLFIWGNNGQLYKLTNKLPPGRYIVAYHMTTSQKTLDETFLAVKKAQPTYVVLMPNVGPFPFSLTHYKPVYNINNVIIYEKSL